MLAYISICFVLTLFYAVIMTLYRSYWTETEEFSLQTEKYSYPSVSVIIPVRNESGHIAKLLEDLLKQNYPEELIEVIVVDDHSDDDTPHIVRGFRNERIQLISLSELLKEEGVTNAYKKKAIETGIRYAKGEIIMTTDGDCRVPSGWIKRMIQIKQASGAKLLTGAVVMNGTDTLFQKFQALDFLGMMGITSAMLKMEIFNMANGANLLYEKAAFDAVNGFQGIDHLASGDDMLLMYKIAQKYEGAVGYAKHPEAVVYTETMPTLGTFLQQRFRWTAKSKDYQDKRMTWILGTVFLFVLSLFVNLFFALFSKIFLFVVLAQIIVKSVVDYRLLDSTAQYYGRRDLMSSFLSSQIFHILYIVFVGSLGNILKFEWKGRTQTK